MFYSANGISGWSQASKLIASDGVQGDYFGVSVAMSDNMIAVGATFADSSEFDAAGTYHYIPMTD